MGDISLYLDANVSPCSERVLVVNLKVYNPGGRANNAVSQGGSYKKGSLKFGVNYLDIINIILYNTIPKQRNLSTKSKAKILY